jgi:cytochrome c oxidase subunit IV
MGNHAEHVKQENHLAMSESEYKHHKTDVWKTTALLSFVTIFEVIFAIYYERSLIPQGAPLWALRVFLIIASLVKAVYIMAVFMHVKHETRSLILTITIPFTLLIWMIIAFLMEGESWNNNNTTRFEPHPAVQKQHSGVVNEHH